MHDAGAGHAAMRPLTTLISHQEALTRILAAVKPVGAIEQVPVESAVGRVLAIDVTAPNDVPAFDRAAMDGYALRSVDAREAPVSLRPVATLHAGHATAPQIGAGECSQVATGAMLPIGADAVVAVERTQLADGKIQLDKPVRHRENVTARASDMKRGETILRQGTVITPARIAVAVAAGRESVDVHRRPRVAVISTGSELRPSGSLLRLGEIHDSNAPALASLFSIHGAVVTRAAPVPDTVDDLRQTLRAHADHDLIVLSGGSSAGEKDVLRDAVQTEGRIEFHGVRVKPGKPLLLARWGDAVIIGLPGFPTSCLSDAYLFVVPALRKLARLPADEPRKVTVRVGHRIESVPGRLWFVPVRLEGGRAVATYKESGATTSLSDAVGYIEVPADAPALEEGDAATVTLV